MKDLLIMLMLLPFFAFAQNDVPKLPTDDNGKITYSEVVTLKDSISKVELFSRAKTSFVNLFKNSKSVIQSEDKETGTIIGKGNFQVFVKSLGTTYECGYINFTFTVSVKDSKYKYVVTNFIHEILGNTSGAGNIENGKPKRWPQKNWDSILTQLNTEATNLISSLKLEMSKASPKSDNW